MSASVKQPTGNIVPARDRQKPQSVDLVVLLCLVGYVAICLAISRKYLYITTPDWVSYVTVAEKYLHGHFADAVSGHWSPLISWLLVPFLAMHVPAEVAVKWINLPCGIGVLLSTWTLTGMLELERRYRRAAVASVTVVVVDWTLTLVGPDLLLLALLLGYFCWILRPNFCERIGDALATGLIGAVCYYAKGYAFPFFVVSFPLMVLWKGWANQTAPRKQMVTLAAGFAVFLILTLPWVAALSSKYGHLTLNTASEFAFKWAAPNTPDPVFNAGLLPPPYEGSVNFWEEPNRIPPQSLAKVRKLRVWA